MCQIKVDGIKTKREVSKVYHTSSGMYRYQVECIKSVSNQVGYIKSVSIKWDVSKVYQIKLDVSKVYQIKFNVSEVYQIKLDISKVYQIKSDTLLVTEHEVSPIDTFFICKKLPKISF